MTVEQPDIKKSLTVFQPLSVMDNLDDAAIIAEIRGEVVKELVYCFPGRDGGREIINLSKAGVDECVSALAHKGECLREMDITYRESGDYYEFISTVGRYVVNKEGTADILLDTCKGFKRQWKNVRLRDGRVVPNDFFFEVGAIKATRNAKIRMISEEIKQAIIKEAIKTKKVVVVKEPLSAADDLVRMKTGYDAWVYSCPIHHVAWTKGSAGKYHKTDEGKGCSLAIIMLREYGELGKRLGYTAEQRIKVVKDITGMAFSYLTETEKVTMLETLANRAKEKVG